MKEDHETAICLQGQNIYVMFVGSLSTGKMFVNSIQ